ncbi:beta-ketoacyl-ACP synthase [Treponema sp.]|uniref:beta-ketoacyl-ACP synthase n=1 Tax=Treponema sp. TaxID=166 RepID=UPI0025FB4EAD|nr:beta-ketoacyl-ACP synthase [Treponema sp.]MCR5218037.1 beta-ketoacyl-ACP synthase [Treponema sp.]
MTFTRPDGKRRVVVTGGGMLTALGDDWTEAFANLKSYKNKIVYMKDWDVYEGMNTRLACPYTKELPSFPRKKIRGMGRVALLSLLATERAFESAGLKDENGEIPEELHNGRTGIAYGSCMGSMDSILDMFSMITDNDVSKINSQTYIKCMPQTCAANLSVYYSLRGRIITTNTACTSGSQSIGYAYEAISSGIQDLMVAGGAEELIPPDAAAFDAMGATAYDNAHPECEPKPFDSKRDGLVIGEGAGTLILEDMEHAVKRGAKIYAEVAGFGTNCDGTHITNPNSETMAQALQLAINDAGISADQIGYVNAHGTSTSAGDVAETQATASVFKRPVPISSTKSYIGHTLGACGCVEAWLTINMMNEAWFHPTLNLTDLDEKCGALDYIKGEGRQIDTEYVMSNNFAFGGVNTSLIFKKVNI